MSDRFAKILGTLDSTSMVVGIIIGSGIFLTTGNIAVLIESPLWILAAWFFGGFITFCGAYTFAQLGILQPCTGGVYVYLRSAFGGAVAYLYGVSLFVVMQCGSIAAIAIGFAYYLGESLPQAHLERTCLPWGTTGYSIVAAALIWVLTMVHYVGGRIGVELQNFLTALKILSLGVFVVAACMVDWHGGPVSYSPPAAGNFGLAMIAVLWTFAGAHNINYVAEEMKLPRRQFPIALLGGVAVVTAIYLAVNVVYLFAVPSSCIKGVDAVAATTAQYLFGSWGRCAIAVAIVLSTMGAVNGLIFATPRAYFAMAGDGVFAGMAAVLHPVYRTPSRFLVLQALWSSVLALTGKYDSMFTFVMFSGFVFFALVGMALLVLRRRFPDCSLIWPAAYPWLPLLYVAVFSLLAANTLWICPKESLGGLAVLALALVFYRRRNS